MLLIHKVGCAKLVLGLLCLSIFNACEWGEGNLSLLRSNPDNFTVIFTDTATVNISTVFLDSLGTTGNRLLVGGYADPYLGKVRAESYLRTVFNGGFKPESRAVFDSLVLSLKYDYHYGDTLQRQTIRVHQVTEDLGHKDKSYQNVNKSAYSTAPIGAATFLARPLRGTRLQIRLADALGQTMMDMSRNNTLQTDADWQKIFRGVALVPGTENNGPMLGFLKDSTQIILYYHTSESNGITSSSYRVEPSHIAYNYIGSDRAGTKLPVAPKLSDRISSSQTDNLSFIQSGVGVMTRIDLPYMRSFKYNANGRVRINKALLRIVPFRDETIRTLTPPVNLSLFRCNLRNQVTGVVFGGAAGAGVTGRYFQDTFNNNYNYELDITQYITELIDPLENSNTMIRSNVDNGEGLLLRITDEYNNSLSRLAIGDQRHPRYTTRLEIYYTYINN